MCLNKYIVTYFNLVDCLLILHASIMKYGISLHVCDSFMNVYVLRYINVSCILELLSDPNRFVIKLSSVLAENHDSSTENSSSYISPLFYLFLFQLFL